MGQCRQTTYSVGRPRTHKRMLISMEQERLDSTLGLLAIPGHNSYRLYWKSSNQKWVL